MLLNIRGVEISNYLIDCLLKNWWINFCNLLKFTQNFGLLNSLKWLMMN